MSFSSSTCTDWNKFSFFSGGLDGVTCACEKRISVSSSSISFSCKVEQDSLKEIAKWINPWLFLDCLKKRPKTLCHYFYFSIPSEKGLKDFWESKVYETGFSMIVTLHNHDYFYFLILFISIFYYYYYHHIIILTKKKGRRKLLKN